MEGAGPKRGKEMRNSPAEGGKEQENAKKILNRGNEPKDVLKTQHLASYGAKNELQTNSILSAKTSKSKRKRGF
jgi:hypothetical protein